MPGLAPFRILPTRVQAWIDSSGATLVTLPTVPMALAQQLQDQSIHPQRRVVESLAAINVLDLDDPATVPPYRVDRKDPVTPITNEPTFDDLRHVSPVFLYALGIRPPPVRSASAVCGHRVTWSLGLRSICR
jgi:hypothetical protein